MATKSPRQPYYIGLDCGTSSVGWAVANAEYQLLRAKGKTLWGEHLFDEAKTAAKRRSHRVERRRGERAKARLKLLRLIFQDEIFRIDREFYKRLRESFYYEEDKQLRHPSRNTLFYGSNYTDKDFHKAYPTIWHLRQAIIHADPDQHFDIRLYFLAIQHILKHRGHFLIEGNIGAHGVDFAPVYDNFADIVENQYGISMVPDAASEVERILLDRTTDKRGKKKALKEVMFREGDELEEDRPKALDNLAGLIVGSSTDLCAITGVEGEEKVKIDISGDLDEKLIPDVSEKLGSEHVEFITAAKRVYECVLLKELQKGHEYITDAMVANYDQHAADLAAIKAVFRSHPEIYHELFKSEEYNKKPSYNAYIGKAYEADSKGRRKYHTATQVDFNKVVEEELRKIGYEGELLERAAQRELLPKQRGQAKGTIPQQLHHKELLLILEKLGHDYPSFVAEVPGEDTSFNTKLKKLAKIHDFRIPYYCGPLVSEKKSLFSWAEQEIDELVRPWNFQYLVKINKIDLDARATKFITRMTNDCSWLLGEPVLPKESLIYQRYMVLNELNNLRVNDERLDVKTKQRIFEAAFLSGAISSSITLSGFQKWLKNNGFIGSDDILSGTSKEKYLPRLTTHHVLVKILGADYAKHYSVEELEEVIQAATVLGQERKMLATRIQKLLSCDEQTARTLAQKLRCKDWGRLSGRLLNGLTAKVDGVDMTILDALWCTQHNFMELLGGEFVFGKAIETVNHSSSQEQTPHQISFRDVESLYCSPSVKRSVWRAIQIVNELAKVLGRPAEKVFLEVTRGQDDKEARRTADRYSMSRRQQLEEGIRAIKPENIDSLLDELEGLENRQLLRKQIYLYFTQMGRCAYTGEKIRLKDILKNSLNYDVDHIYPRSLTKDDSLTRNLVLVKATENREKSSEYPLKEGIRNSMRNTWLAWRRAGLITKEKYDRLIRPEPLTADELAGFIARQIVETSQTVIAVRELLHRAYPKTRIVLVKAKQVSELRKHLGYDRRADKNGNPAWKGLPEFIKVRDLNDHHHAKDAYLNIVVGNVMQETFTDTPYQYIKQKQEKNGVQDPKYTVATHRIFRDTYEYHGKEGRITHWPLVQAWSYSDSIEQLSRTMRRNDVICTRMSRLENGELYDLTLVGKSEKTDGILPIKQNGRLDPKKYGGYNSVKGAFFVLIEQAGKKGALERRLVQVPIMHAKRPEQYLAEQYPGSQLVLGPVKIGSSLLINGIPMTLAGRTKQQLILYHAIQLFLPPEQAAYLKHVIKVTERMRKEKDHFKLDPERDKVDQTQNQALFDELYNKLKMVYREVPGYTMAISKLSQSHDKFAELNIEKQCSFLVELLKVMSANAQRGDLTAVIKKTSEVGKSTISNEISKLASCILIHRSITGLYEERIDLKTVAPRKFNRRRLNLD